MQRLLVLFAVAAVALSYEGGKEKGKGKRGDMFGRMAKRIPECREYLGDDTDMFSKSIPNCDQDTSYCFANAHKRAKACVMEEMRKRREAGEAARRCFRERREDHKEWFRLSCKWHAAVDKCMEGEVAEAGAQIPHFFKTADPVELVSHREHQMRHMKAQDCWKEVHDMTDGCYRNIGDGCANYKTCSGKEPSEDARLSQWYHVIRQLKKEKNDKTHEMHRAMKECIENAQDAEGNDV